MTSQTSQIIQKLILPSCKELSENSIQSLKLLIQETKLSMSQKEFESHLDQWKVLGKKLNTNDKLTYLRQQNCRILLIDLIKQDAMKIFNTSYLNRAKIDNEYIRYLKQLGPYFFIEVIIIVSKLKTIHRHFYQRMSRKMIQNHISIKILKILQLCNDKKRSINNNKSKFLCIVEDQNDRLEITKQLGKMLRESWKKQKSKQKIQQQQEENIKCFQLQDMELTPIKQLVKPIHFFNSNQQSDRQSNDPFIPMDNFEYKDFRSRSRDQFDIFLQDL